MNQDDRPPAKPQHACHLGPRTSHDAAAL
jgi:hypothetical protein